MPLSCPPVLSFYPCPGLLTFCTAVVVFHTRFSYWVSNTIGIIKVLTLIFISITGFVVLGGHVSRVPDPKANFVRPFEGEATAYGLTNALYRIIFSYAGYENAFNVVNEVKVCYFHIALSFFF